MNWGWFKNFISKMFTNYMNSITNHMYNYLTMCQQIADIKLNC